MLYLLILSLLSILDLFNFEFFEHIFVCFLKHLFVHPFGPFVLIICTINLGLKLPITRKYLSLLLLILGLLLGGTRHKLQSAALDVS